MAGSQALPTMRDNRENHRSRARSIRKEPKPMSARDPAGAGALSLSATTSEQALPANSERRMSDRYNTVVAKKRTPRSDR